MIINETTYRKDRILAVGKGYQTRPGGITPTSIVIHTTNNSKPTSLDFEATYLRNSLAVSTHYLVGKRGEALLILPPELMAWHAGEALTAWRNEHSIGIEAHVSIGEAWTAAQHDALTELVRMLMQRYGIAPELIETHRKIAVPKGRKRDPEGWNDEAFYAWRAALAGAPPDPFAGWGTAFPLDPAQRGWGIPQTWLKNQWLGQARSAELYSPDGLRSIQWFVGGWIIYEKNVNWAMAYHASTPVA